MASPKRSRWPVRFITRLQGEQRLHFTCIRSRCTASPTEALRPWVALRRAFASCSLVRLVERTPQEASRTGSAPQCGLVADQTVGAWLCFSAFCDGSSEGSPPRSQLWHGSEALASPPNPCVVGSPVFWPQPPRCSCRASAGSLACSDPCWKPCRASRHKLHNFYKHLALDKDELGAGHRTKGHKSGYFCPLPVRQKCL